MNGLNQRSIADLIDHTLLRPDTTYADIIRLCEEAILFGFYAVCINPYFIKPAKELLKGSNVRIATVIGFPFGMTLTEVKVYEAMNAFLLGADEIDIVVNIGALKSGDWFIVKKDLSDVIIATRGIIHKTIIETCYLNNFEKKKAIEIALDSGTDFIKTSTGFGTQGTKVSDIKLIKGIVRDAAGIKAAGGIRTLRQVIDMLNAGATRIGTSSGVNIMREFKERQEKEGNSERRKNAH